MQPRTVVIAVGLCALLTVTAFEGISTTADDGFLEMEVGHDGRSEEEVAELTRKVKEDVSDVQTKVHKVSNEVAKGTFMAMMASKEVKDAKFLVATTQAAAKRAEREARKLAKDAAREAIRRAKHKVTAMIKLAKAKATMVEQAELQGHNRTSSVLAAAKKMYNETYAKALRGVQSAKKLAAKVPAEAFKQEHRAVKHADALAARKVRLANQTAHATDRSALAAREAALQEAKKAEQREVSALKDADQVVQALKQKIALMDTSTTVEEAQVQAAKELVRKHKAGVEHLQRKAVRAKQKLERRQAAQGSAKRAVSFVKKMKQARQEARKAAQAVRLAQQELQNKAYVQAQAVRAHVKARIRRLSKAAKQELHQSETQLSKWKLTAERQRAALKAGKHAIGEAAAIHLAKKKVVKAVQWQKAKSIVVPHINSTVQGLQSAISKLSTKAAHLKKAAHSKGLMKKALTKAMAKAAKQKAKIALKVAMAKKEVAAKSSAAAAKVAKMKEKLAAVKAVGKKTVNKASKATKAVAPVIHLEINNAAKSVQRAVLKARKDLVRARGHTSYANMQEHLKTLDAVMRSAEHEYARAKDDVATEVIGQHHSS